MKRAWIKTALVAATVLSAGSAGALEADAGGWGRLHGGGSIYGCYYPPTNPDLFYNFYVPPCDYAGAGAQLYVAPRPTPPLVGHTYITYQPLLPHEFLYKHHRTYYRYHPGSGVTKTKVHWW